MKITYRWRDNTISRCMKVLSMQDKIKYGVVALLQLFLGIFDLFAIAAIGLLSVLTINGIQSKSPGVRTNIFIDLIHIKHLSFQYQVAVLGCIAVILMVSRTILSIVFTRRILYFLSRKSATISGELVAKLLSRNLLEIQKRTTQETLFALTTGVSTVTVGVLGAFIGLISDMSLLFIMSIGLFFINPLMAGCTFVLFGSVALILYKMMQVRIRFLGQEVTELTVKSNEKILEVLNSYRESFVRNRRNYYATEISQSRMNLANSAAEMSFMPNISKYAIEITLVVGALAISAVQFMTQTATLAIATLSIFIAAASRIAPAVLRLQQGAIQIKGSIGSAKPTLILIEELKNSLLIEESTQALNFKYTDFEANLLLENLTFTYPGNQSPAIKNINLQIKKGDFIAFVGASGAGKTTLVDILLGIIEPDVGRVVISGLSPKEAIQKWEGAISYVPQDIIISSGSIRENVALGYSKILADEKIVLDAIELSSLGDFIRSLPDGIETYVGERGAKLSGGQRQRLGIARALFTKPELIVFDEATSALDGQTENEVSQSIKSLQGKVTIIMIAHRLSTIRYADKVVYLESGEIIGEGTFDKLRNTIPNFEKQAKLMGL